MKPVAMTADPLPDELERVYSATYDGVPSDGHDVRHGCALLAVYRAGQKSTQSQEKPHDHR